MRIALRSQIDRHFAGRPASGERIEDHIAFLGRRQDHLAHQLTRPDGDVRDIVKPPD